MNLICLPSRAYRLHDAKNVRIEEHQRQVELGVADSPLQACHTLLSSECMSVMTLLNDDRTTRRGATLWNVTYSLLQFLGILYLSLLCLTHKSPYSSLLTPSLQYNPVLETGLWNSSSSSSHIYKEKGKSLFFQSHSNHSRSNHKSTARSQLRGFSCVYSLLLSSRRQKKRVEKYP